MKNYEINLNVKAISMLRKIYSSPGMGNIELMDIYGIQYEHYLSQLIENRLVEDRRERLHDSDRGTYLGCYVITSSGIAYLENYSLIERKSRKEFLFKSVFIPIAVSIVTSIVIYLLQALLKQILK